jgi:ribosomal protein L29
MGKGKGKPEFWVAVVRPAASCSKSVALPKAGILCHETCRTQTAHQGQVYCSRSRRRKQTMKTREIRELTHDEIAASNAAHSWKEWFNLRMQKALKPLQNRAESAKFAKNLRASTQFCTKKKLGIRKVISTKLDRTACNYQTARTTCRFFFSGVAFDYAYSQNMRVLHINKKTFAV